MPLSLSVYKETWPLMEPFAISRGTKSNADVVVTEISDGIVIGKSECVPYPRYGETVDGVMGDIETFFSHLKEIKNRQEFLNSIPAGAARNGLDNACWDLEAKLASSRVWELANIPSPKHVVTAETIGLDSEEKMAKNALRLVNSPLIKVKLDENEVINRISSIRNNAPSSRIIVDPNEGWTMEQLCQFAPRLRELGVEMIEQPIPACEDNCLKDYECPIPICADESCHTSDDLQKLIGKYQMVNIKLDKTGGLTEALRLERAARTAGFEIMVGCMIGTSLSMAPATLLCHNAKFVDLDGPLFLKKDRECGLRFEKGKVGPPVKDFWG